MPCLVKNCFVFDNFCLFSYSYRESNVLKRRHIQAGNGKNSLDLMSLNSSPELFLSFNFNK